MDSRDLARQLRDVSRLTGRFVLRTGRGSRRVLRRLAEYETDGAHGTDFHRPLSTYLNAVIGLGGRLREIVEPGLDPATAATGGSGPELAGVADSQ